jgi:ribosomal protein S18 acetylase RimI-like enzyme
MISIERAGVQDLDAFLPLFEAYREFYRCKLDAEAARRYLRERLDRGESTVFLAWTDDPGATGQRRAVGFTQLYPAWASLRLGASWVLYDLFVDSTVRRGGVARLLMDRAVQHARGSGATIITLETAVDNTPAQALYESLGWKRDTDFYTYYLEL